MAFWLVKSEPDAFSWAQQIERGVEPWTGVRNHAAAGNLRAMQVGELAFFYHSNVGKEIVGVVEVARAAYPDPTAETGKAGAGKAGAGKAGAGKAGAGNWVCVDMRAVAPMPRPVTLAAMKADAALEGFALLRLSRLSVVPVGEAHWRHICTLGGWTGHPAGHIAR